MKLFLMRHAEAKTLNHQDDRLRELTHNDPILEKWTV